MFFREFALVFLIRELCLVLLVRELDLWLLACELAVAMCNFPYPRRIHRGGRNSRVKSITPHYYKLHLVR